MTTEILTENKVDWDKPQWVTNGNEIILTNGKHTVVKFEGLCLPCESCPNGKFFNYWNKSEFKQIPAQGLTIKIKND